MIKFLLKGILHDRNRSLSPILVISIGVMLTVVLHTWLTGIMGESVVMNANFNTGHLKVVTTAYAADEAQMPNDLALLGVDNLVKDLEIKHADLKWVKRIRFGGLIDFPDENGETRVQSPVVGWAVDLFSPGSGEIGRFNLGGAIIDGHLPEKAGEALITNLFHEKFNVKTGDAFTLFGTNMEGGMAFSNFTVAGTVSFGTQLLDRGAIVIDITDAQKALAMENAASEILGFFPNGHYNRQKADAIFKSYNTENSNLTDEYAPVMQRLTDQGGMAEFMAYSESVGGMMIFIFVLAMSVVLWNTGLLGGLRRYTEFGVRLALGEEKSHIYRTLIYEGILIGIIGSVFGTAVGLGIAWYLQEVGLDIGGMMQNSTLMIPSKVRGLITPATFYIGFIPGVLSMVAGNALAGIGIYKRQTSQLFKELEV